MWNNIGGKIKTLAKVIFWIEAACFIIGGIVMLAKGIRLNGEMRRYSYYENEPGTILILCGLAMMVIGPLMAWIGSFLLCGFGQLIESSEQTANNTYRLMEQNEHLLQMHTNSNSVLTQILDVNNAALHVTRKMARNSAQQDSGEKGTREQ